MLGLRLLADDEELQAAIRCELHRCKPSAGAGSDPQSAIAAVMRKRRKLLDLHCADRISEDQFAEEEVRLTAQLDALRDEDRQLE